MDRENVVARGDRRAAVLIALAAAAADYPAPKEGDWIARDFRFHTGEVMPELRLHYTTIGAPTGEPCWSCTAPRIRRRHADRRVRRRAVRCRPAARGEQIFHHPAGRGRRGEIVQAIGRPAQFRDSLRRHGRRPVSSRDRGLGHPPFAPGAGNSMGGMPPGSGGATPISWIRWSMASQPTEMAGRNWMMRRMLIDAIRNDPGWNNGDTPPSRALQVANVFYGIATSGGSQAYHKAAPRASRPTSCSTRGWQRLYCRRQRLSLSVGRLARLQSGAQPRPYSGRAARHQLSRRRTQSARARNHGARA